MSAKAPVLTIWLCQRCGHRIGDGHLEGESVVEIICPKCKAMNTKRAA